LSKNIENKSLTRSFIKNFGIISEYNSRAAAKIYNTHSLEESPKFFTTSARPGNFGDNLDFKV